MTPTAFVKDTPPGARDYAAATQATRSRSCASLAGTVADVLAVFGAWVAITGAAQLVVALRRRAQFGNQWPMLLAGGFSIIAGVAFLVLAAGHDPKLKPLVLYTATGGTEFVIQAWLPARRRRCLATPAARS